VTIGSAAEIGSTAASILPVTEDVACSPDSAYGQSKLEVTRLALAERLDSSLEIVVARPFNLIGPGLSPQLSLGSFAQQAVSVLRGEAVAVRCGSLDARRDFVDIRDAVQAYVALAERGRARQVYNVCAGRSYRIGDLLERLIGLTGAPLRVVIDPARCRPGELPDIYGDHSKITREVGWRPRIPINRSLAELLAAAAVESIKRDPRAGTNRQLSKAG
jgi:GDP-4-dehydro-6-deoxy-D-mannose reductase